MPVKRKHFTVFEHRSIKLNDVIDGVKFDEPVLKAFQSYYGDNGVPYFSLIHKGVRFNEYVGVIQIGNTVVEVLPKADCHFKDSEEKAPWRNILINMLLAVGVFDIHAPSSSVLKLKPNSMLDLYFELFINEIEYLLNSGLIKKYRRNESNIPTLKGNIQFNKHLQHNYIHQERFYVNYTHYDSNHILHSIIYKTILLLRQINTSAMLHSRIGSLLLNFPEMPEVKVTENTFNRIIYNRKTQCYKKAMEIAKLLLLQFHPDIRTGRNSVLALMLDMNKLWEQFVYVSLRKHKESNTTIAQQCPMYFWKPDIGYRSRIKPDIVIDRDSSKCVVIDAKWKNLNGSNPSPDDLRQMYVYHEYFEAKRVALVYPGPSMNRGNGTYLDPSNGAKTDKECSVISLSVNPNVKIWQMKIYQEVQSWLGF